MKLPVQPGWKWSQDIKPIVGTDSCQETCWSYRRRYNHLQT